MISYILALVVGALIIAADQISKMIVASNMDLGGKSVKFIEGFMEFSYIYNEGGAWGLLSGKTWILVSVTVIAMLICVALLFRHGTRSKLMFWAVTLILSGGIGNMIDRVFRDGKVIDFLHFQFIDFPVFNIADIAVCIGTGLLFLYFIMDTIKDLRARKKNASDKENGEV